ncbi:DUF1700 domain-containing protein [Chitinibacter tainanensis]|uniref:DUF1700 domain-containing protein n=1 Tax=Chitinibacter tainanensis TaxID=230667 RepID=UPI0004225067|nr:DUF1700 domain-containing protein [Chitinibacter tainanensis]
MQQTEFLNQLEAALQALPAAERAEILADYRAYFADGLADGRSEAEIAMALGDPARLARELLAERCLQSWEAHKSPRNLWGALVALGGLGIINVLLALPYLLMLTVLSSLWLGALGITFAGLLLTGTWATQTVFGWPSLNHSWATVAQDETGWPWAGRQAGEIWASGPAGESVHIQRQSDGQVIIQATDGDDELHIRRDASGAVQEIRASDGENVLNIGGWMGPTPGALLATGLGLLLLGGFGVVVGGLILRAIWRGTGRWLRWQAELVSGQTTQSAV